MPDTGQASFTGDYAALVIEDATGVVTFALSGDVSFTADFDDATISGAITNRVDTSDGYVDVTLDAATITDGAFSGTTSGGGRSGYPGSSTNAGNYSGLLVNADGDEVVGGVEIGHTFVVFAGPFDATEYGAFVAAE